MDLAAVVGKGTPKAHYLFIQSRHDSAPTILLLKELRRANLVPLGMHHCLGGPTGLAVKGDGQRPMQ